MNPQHPGDGDHAGQIIYRSQTGLVAEILETLVSLGQAMELPDGRCQA
ncbi:MAG: hypothetical protein ACOVMP_00670 [Chthoniobacterales bacterium]